MTEREDFLLIFWRSGFNFFLYLVFELLRKNGFLVWWTLGVSHSAFHYVITITYYSRTPPSSLSICLSSIYLSVCPYIYPSHPIRYFSQCLADLISKKNSRKLLYCQEALKHFGFLRILNQCEALFYRSIRAVWIYLSIETHTIYR